MKRTILSVLKTLEEQSGLERTRKVDVAPKERMLAITEDTGILINMMMRHARAKNALEIGMSVGYSTIWCAEAVLEQSGKVITVEQDAEKIKRAEENFVKAGIRDGIIIKRGQAMDILSQLYKERENREFFDFVLIDADKENVIEYFDLVLPMVSVGGMIVTDNMLYPQKYRQDMERFSAYLNKNRKLRTVTVPIGNGIEVTIKIEN